MKSRLLSILLGLNCLIAVVVLVVVVGIYKQDDILGERTSLFRPYIDVSGTSTARTSDTVGTSTPASVGAYRTFIDTAATNFRGLVIRGVTGQTANLIEAQNDAGTVIWSIDSGGGMGSTTIASTLTVLNINATGTTVTSTISGNFSVLGNFQFGNAAGDLIALTGRLSTGITPNVNGTLDLGTNALSFRSLYLGTGLFASGSLSVGTNGTSATSTIFHGLNIIGDIARGGINLKATSTITLSFAARSATDTLSLSEFRLPWNCEIGEISLVATSTNASSYRSVVDVQVSLSETTRNFNSIYSGSGRRVDLGANQNVSSTSPIALSSSTLLRGNMIRAQLTQRDEKDGLFVQIDCSKPVW